MKNVKLDVSGATKWALWLTCWLYSILVGELKPEIGKYFSKDLDIKYFQICELYGLGSTTQLCRCSMKDNRYMFGAHMAIPIKFYSQKQTIRSLLDNTLFQPANIPGMPQMVSFQMSSVWFLQPLDYWSGLWAVGDHALSSLILLPLRAV